MEEGATEYNGNGHYLSEEGYIIDLIWPTQKSLNKAMVLQKIMAHIHIFYRGLRTTQGLGNCSGAAGVLLGSPLEDSRHRGDIEALRGQQNAALEAALRASAARKGPGAVGSPACFIHGCCWETFEAFFADCG